MLEVIEVALDQIALAVDATIDATLDEAIPLRGDMGLGAGGPDEIEQRARIVATVGLTSGMRHFAPPQTGWPPIAVATSYVVMPGDVIGFPVSCMDRANYSIVAVSDLHFNSCSHESYVDLCYKRPQFGLALSWLAAREAAPYAENLVGLGRRTPIERLAHFLLAIHVRLLEAGRAEARSFDLPFSQEIMSDVLGLSVPHLNRTMRQLRSEKLITSKARSIELTNFSGLQSLAQYQPLDLVPIPRPL